MNGLPQLETNFTPWDWVIVAAYLLGTLGIGLYARRYIRDMSDYVVAGRSLKSFLAIATMIGTELGLVTVMYAAQKGFTGGLAAFHIGLAAGIVTLLVGLTGFIVVPLRRLEVMTIPEFYEKRFGRGVRILGGLLLAGAGILNMGMFLKAGALFIAPLTGLPQHADIAPLLGLENPLQIPCVNLVMSLLIVLVLVYTILGGMISVVITDYVQFIVLSFGMIFCCFLAWKHLGWTTIVDTVKTVHAEAGFDPFHTKGFGPSYVVWMIFVAGLVSCAIWQTAVMRACAAENTRVVRRLYIWSSIGFMIRFILPQFLGICALAYLWKHPAAHAAFFTADGAVVDDPELTMQAMPLLLGQLLPAGLIGLVGAGMLAAFMSTHDSYLLCWSSVLVEDVVAPIAGGKLSNKGRLTLARLLILLIGAFLLVWSLWYPLEQDLWDYMAVSGAIYFIGAFALLLAGLYWKRASRVGAYLALICGLYSVFGLEQLRESYAVGLAVMGIVREPPAITEAHVGLATTALALVLMVVGSLVFPDRNPTAKPRA